MQHPPQMVALIKSNGLLGRGFTGMVCDGSQKKNDKPKRHPSEINKFTTKPIREAEGGKKNEWADIIVIITIMNQKLKKLCWSLAI